jgi:opacity protein-like surface antigen
VDDEPEPFDGAFESDTGHIFGVALGVDLTRNVALELEYAYRNLEAVFDYGLDDGGTVDSNAYMLNALYNFTPLGTTGRWQPYVGGGLGAATLSLRGFSSMCGLPPCEESPDPESDDTFAVAYQAIGGVGYAVNPNLTLAGELRYFGISGQDFDNGTLSFSTDFQTIDVLVGAIYSF